jgi:hypothetical protein
MEAITGIKYRLKVLQCPGQLSNIADIPKDLPNTITHVR